MSLDSYENMGGKNRDNQPYPMPHYYCLPFLISHSILDFKAECQQKTEVSEVSILYPPPADKCG